MKRSARNHPPGCVINQTIHAPKIMISSCQVFRPNHPKKRRMGCSARDSSAMTVCPSIAIRYVDVIPVSAQFPRFQVRSTFSSHASALTVRGSESSPVAQPSLLMISRCQPVGRFASLVSQYMSPRESSSSLFIWSNRSSTRRATAILSALPRNVFSSTQTRPKVRSNERNRGLERKRGLPGISTSGANGAIRSYGKADWDGF